MSPAPPPATPAAEGGARRPHQGSSSLVRPTPDDPSDPCLPEGCQITAIDRLRAPYKPAGDQVRRPAPEWEVALDISSP